LGCRRSPDWSPKTALENKRPIRLKIVPWLDFRRVWEIKAIELDACYTEVRATGNEKGEALSPASGRRAHISLHVGLEQAVKWGLLATNPADAATPPSLPSQPVRRFLELPDALSYRSSRRRQGSSLDAETAGYVADQRVFGRHDERPVGDNSDGEGFGSKPVQASAGDDRRHHGNEEARADEPDAVRQVVDPLAAEIVGQTGELSRHRAFAAARWAAFAIR